MPDEAQEGLARQALTGHRVPERAGDREAGRAGDRVADCVADRARFHRVPFGDIWLRDTAPDLPRRARTGRRPRCASSSTAGAASTCSSTTTKLPSASPRAPGARGRSRCRSCSREAPSRWTGRGRCSRRGSASSTRTATRPWTGTRSRPRLTRRPRRREGALARRRAAQRSHRRARRHGRALRAARASSSPWSRGRATTRTATRSAPCCASSVSSSMPGVVASRS